MPALRYRIAHHVRMIQRWLWRRARPSVNRFGLDLVRLDAFPFIRHIERLNVTVVLDVGANIGQTGDMLRRNGYRGKIVSFEPISDAYALLSQAARADGAWYSEHCAVGSVNGQIDINVSDHSTMSSVREIKAETTAAFAFATVVGKETVEIRTLDDMFSDHVGSDDVVLLKMDVQGFEDEVLKGAQQSLARITLVLLEAAVKPAYRDESRLFDHYKYLEDRGYQLIDITEALRDAGGRLLYVDCLFERISPT